MSHTAAYASLLRAVRLLLFCVLFCLHHALFRRIATMQTEQNRYVPFTSRYNSLSRLLSML